MVSPNDVVRKCADSTDCRELCQSFLDVGHLHEHEPYRLNEINVVITLEVAFGVIWTCSRLLDREMVRFLSA